jgi:hypothetical protein
MELELRMKYCETVYRRYRNASKDSKARILDELCQVCGYNRKYAIWKLNRLRDKEKAKTTSKRRRSRKYGPEVLLIVEKVWKKSGYPWSVRLKEILRLWLLVLAPIKRMIMLILNKKTGPMCGSSWVGTDMTLLKLSSP